jgi:DNA-binding NtrC family response regulator
MLARFGSRRGATESTLTPEAVAMLQEHEWPGNIRELANAIERATILAGGGPIRPEHLPTQVPARRGSASAISSPAAISAVPGPHFQIPEGTPTLRDVEMKFIQVILEKHHGNKPAASKELGISLKTLYNKINQLQQS